MTKREAAIVEAYTGICMLTGEDRKYAYEYASEILGRPIFTHEFVWFYNEFKEKSNLIFSRFVRIWRADNEM